MAEYLPLCNLKASPRGLSARASWAPFQHCGLRAVGLLHIKSRGFQTNHRLRSRLGKSCIVISFVLYWPPNSPKPAQF